jgi:hypothetical protein
LYDEAVNGAFNHAWHLAMKATCGKGCFPVVDSVKIQIHDVSYDYQRLVSALYWEPNFTCIYQVFVDGQGYLHSRETIRRFDATGFRQGKGR